MKLLQSAVLAALLCLLPTLASAKVNVFACVPEWASLARELGGDKVSVYQATSARQDPHRIEARPSLVAQMRSADILVCMGADLEVGWLPVLLQSAGNRKVQRGSPGFFLAAELVDRLDVPTSLDRAEGHLHPLGNPHIQLNPHKVATVATELSRRLAQIDPQNADYYAERGRDFQSRWQQAIQRWEAQAAPLRSLRVVSYHRDALYLIDWLGMVEVMNIEPKPGIPPTAGHLADLLTRLQPGTADLIVRMVNNDPKAAQWLSERTAIPLVELPFTVGGSREAKDLFSLFDDTISRLLRASNR
jgi:zinc/manganese transport system substrate-binding protein